jgi:hypothetical protein
MGFFWLIKTHYSASEYELIDSEIKKNETGKETKLIDKL